MNKLQQLQEEVEKQYQDKFVASITSSAGNIEHARAVIFFDDITKIGEFMEESIEKAFKLGQLSGIELSEGCIPGQMEEPQSYQLKDRLGRTKGHLDVLGFNTCRTESLTNLSDLKQKI